MIHGDSHLPKTTSAEAVPSENAPVKIPRSTHNVLPEQYPNSKHSSAVSSQHPRPNRHKTGYLGRAPQLPLTRGLRAQKSVGGQPTESKRASLQLTAHVTKTRALSSRSNAKDQDSAGSQLNIIPSQSGGNREEREKREKRGKRGKSSSGRASTKTARARLGEDRLANEGARTHRASKMSFSLTSPSAQNSRHDTVPSSPNVRGQQAKVNNSSPQQWTDYANQQPSPLSHISRNPRGARMSQRALSSLQRSRNTGQRQYGGPILRPCNDWKLWVEVEVVLHHLTPNVGTRDIWSSFNKEGNITSIELFENNSRRRTGTAKIKFCPPPTRAFWNEDSYRVSTAEEDCYVRMELGWQPRTFKAPSPVDPKKYYEEVMTLDAGSVDIGIMYNHTTMMSMFTAVPSTRPIKFRQSMLYREIVVELEIDICDPRPPGTHPQVGRQNRKENIRFNIPFRQLEEIYQVEAEQNMVVFVMSLDQPPQVFRKVDELYTHEDSGRFWNHHDAWYRQTDIIYDHQSLRSSPLTLRKFKPTIDIGRWTTYRFSFDMKRNDRQIFNEMCQALKDYNVRITHFPEFRLIRDREPAVWDYIDKPVVVQTRSKNAIEELNEDVVPPLTFLVRFQLEVCISQGVLNEHNLTQDFVTQLMNMDPAKAQDVLEYIANQKKRLYDPMKVFSITVIKGSASRRNIPHYCAYIRSATVTPTTVYYNTPTVETSNRVIRQYAEHADRFLRVRFADEKFRGRINSTNKDTMNEIFTRIKRIMINGIVIGDRHYEFLAFGNSQFREHGAYFFAPLPYLTASRIRQWMGDFSEIQTVAKHAARLGQCFSTTRAINCTKAIVKPIEDIKRNGYKFSDGVGKISPFLAQLAAGELGLATPEPPSIFQFRLGGCKGVLAVWPDVPSREIHVRRTQEKFPAIHHGLEIIRWSQMASASLNRQLILVLSSLGVADDVFLTKLKVQLASLERAMTEGTPALALLQKDIDRNQVTLALAGMILDGFQKTKEPFLVSLLHLWRAWSIKYLKEKARIAIKDGALLFGCVDETGILKGHYNGMVIDNTKTLQDKEAMLPEVFVQLSKGPDDKPYVVKGPMLLARNPSLHPGDIRVVRGVDVPALRHLKDAVVLPRTGDRDISSMCAGGDLDGDDYVVMWDKDLLPPEWNHEPMDYTAPNALELDRDVTIDDITSFFVKYIKNDTLGTIAHAHIAQADYSDYGIKDERCLKLASLHSTAVDFVKSGLPATLSRDLRPRQWPHFMEKNKPKQQTYDSKKILGQLYDHIERVDFVPAFDHPFDQRILQAYALNDDIVQKAAALKLEYDAAIRRIMAQHEIKTEFEVWSAFVLQHSNVLKDFKLHEEISIHSQSLKDEFRAECYRMAGGKDFQLIAPFVAAMYHVTNEEMQMALRECHRMVNVAGADMPLREMVPSSMPLMSFPWLFPNILGRIANRGSGASNEGSTAAVHAEPKYAKPAVRSKKIFEITEDDMLLETPDRVVHPGEKLALFQHPDKQEADPGKRPATPQSTAAFSSLVVSKMQANSGNVHTLLDDEPATTEAIKHPPLAKVSISSASSSTSLELGFGDSRALNPNTSRLDEPFRHEENNIGKFSFSKILTLTNPKSASPSRDNTRCNHQGSSAESLVNTDNSGSNADDEWVESEDEDEDEGMIEVHHEKKGLSYLDRLTRLNES